MSIILGCYYSSGIPGTLIATTINLPNSEFFVQKNGHLMSTGSMFEYWSVLSGIHREPEAKTASSHRAYPNDWFPRGFLFSHWWIWCGVHLPGSLPGYAFQQRTHHDLQESYSRFLFSYRKWESTRIPWKGTSNGLWMLSQLDPGTNCMACINLWSHEERLRYWQQGREELRIFSKGMIFETNINLFNFLEIRYRT